MIVNLNLKDRKVIIVGGGPEALKKVKTLLNENCTVWVFSKKFHAGISKLAKQKKITIKKINIKNANFISKHNPFLVIAATNDSEINKRITQKAKRLKVISYSIDDPNANDISFMSIVNIKDFISVGISTGGKSPIIAKKIRKKATKMLCEIVTDEDLIEAKIQDIIRKASQKKIPNQAERKRFLYSIFKDKHIKQLIKDKKFMKAEETALEKLSKWK